MTALRSAARLALVTLFALPAFGCGQLPMTATMAAATRHDFSGAEAYASHKPRRTPKRTHEEGPANVSKFLCNAANEAKLPGAFILSKDSEEFRQAEASKADGERHQLASRITGNSQIMGAFANWDGQSADAKLAVLKQISDIEGQVMGFTAPPMTTKTGVPQDGTMAFFAGARDGIGSVTLFPEAIAKGDKWAAIATVTHEMRHAYQFQLVQKAAKKKLAEGTPDMTLAYGFYQADMFINKAGGEDNMSYGDYSHLNNEWDAFATGNMVAEIVSKGEANTSGLGFVDVQFNASGTPYVALTTLEQKVGADKLLDAVNQLELKVVQANKGKDQ